jgi:hypothetical protein
MDVIYLDHMFLFENIFLKKSLSKKTKIIPIPVKN